MTDSRSTTPHTETGPVLEVTDLTVDFGVDGAWYPAAKNSPTT